MSAELTYIQLMFNTSALNIVIYLLLYRKFTGYASYEICERLDDFEGRLLHLELILSDASDSYNMS